MKGRLRHYASLTGATAVSQGFILLVAPVVTRLYSPSTFGAFGLLLGVGALVGSVGTGRLEHAIPVARSTADAVRIFTLGALLVVVFSCIAMVFVLGLEAAGVLASTAWNDIPLSTIPVLAISLALFQLTNAILLRQRFYRRVAVNKLMQGLTTGVTQVVLGVLGLTSLGLVLAQVAGYLTGCTAGLGRLVGKLRAMAAGRRFRLHATLSAFRNFPLILAPAALFNQASQQAPLLAIGSIFGLQEAGLYALTQRVCGVPMALVGQSVSQVYASDFREVQREGGAPLARHYRSLLFRLIIVGTLAVSGIVGVLVTRGEFLFGHEWSRLGHVALYLIPMLILDFATTPTSMTLGYLGKERTQLLWDVGRLVAVVVVLVRVSRMSLVFEQGLLLLSIVSAASLIVHAILTYRACKRYEAGCARV